MAEKCIYKSAVELPETMLMFHVERALGVARATAYNFAAREDFPKFQGGIGEAIRTNKQAFLNLIGYVPLVLTAELAATPLIWDVEDVAAYMKVHIETAYEMCRKADAPVIRIGKRRIKLCREAWLVYVGYQEPVVAA